PFARATQTRISCPTRLRSAPWSKPVIEASTSRSSPLGLARVDQLRQSIVPSQLRSEPERPRRGSRGNGPSDVRARPPPVPTRVSGRLASQAAPRADGNWLAGLLRP